MASFTSIVNQYWPENNAPGLGHNAAYGSWVQKISTRISNCGSCSNSPVNMWSVPFKGCKEGCSASGHNQCSSNFCQALADVTGNTRRRLEEVETQEIGITKRFKDLEPYNPKDFLTLRNMYFPDSDKDMTSSYDEWMTDMTNRLTLCATPGQCAYNPLQMYFRKITSYGSCNEICDAGTQGKFQTYPPAHCRNGAGDFCKALADSWEWFATDFNPAQLNDIDCQCTTGSEDCSESTCSGNMISTETASDIVSLAGPFCKDRAAEKCADELSSLQYSCRVFRTRMCVALVMNGFHSPTGPLALAYNAYLADNADKLNR